MANSENDIWDWQNDQSTADISKWTFDEEAMFRYDTRQAPTVIDSGRELRNPVFHRRAVLSHDGVERSGLLILVHRNFLDVFYRRLLVTSPWFRNTNRLEVRQRVALLHTTQGVSYDESGDFADLLHGDTSPLAAQFLALTDVRSNWTANDLRRAANVGTLKGTKLSLSSELREENNVIVVLHPSLSKAVIEQAERLAGDCLPAAKPITMTNDGQWVFRGAEHTLHPSYGLHLPQVEVDNLFWAVDGSALDQSQAVIEDTHSIKEQKRDALQETEDKVQPQAKTPIIEHYPASRSCRRSRRKRADTPLG